MKISIDKIASSTRNAKLARELMISEQIVCKEGYVIAARVLNEKNIYNTLELNSGRMSKLCKGDIIVGVLGMRNALKGFSGVVPSTLKAGDIIQILNLGGVLGTCTSSNAELGRPIDIEVLGAVLHFPSFEHRIGLPAHIFSGEVKCADTIVESAPLIIVTGTCMNSGKTRAACELIKHLSRSEMRVAAAKLSGISLMRDTLEMADHGACRVLNFTDAGIVCSTPQNVLSAAKGIVSTLSASMPSCIVLEFGDGIMGEYGVMSLLEDSDLMSHVVFHILCANDQVGAWGAQRFLAGKCPPPDLIAGPVTDNEVGKRFIERELHIPARNAITEGAELAELALRRLTTVTQSNKDKRVVALSRYSRVKDGGHLSNHRAGAA